MRLLVVGRRSGGTVRSKSVPKGAVRKCRIRRPAEDAIRTGTWISFRRIVAVVTLVRLDPLIVLVGAVTMRAAALRIG